MCDTHSQTLPNLPRHPWSIPANINVAIISGYPALGLAIFHSTSIQYLHLTFRNPTHTVKNNAIYCLHPKGYTCCWLWSKQLFTIWHLYNEELFFWGCVQCALSHLYLLWLLVKIFWQCVAWYKEVDGSKRDDCIPGRLPAPDPRKYYICVFSILYHTLYCISKFCFLLTSTNTYFSILIGFFKLKDCVF